MIKLSPSLIEKYRQHVREEYNGFITREKVIEGIKGEEVWTPKAEFGTAFHLVLENGADKYWNESAQKYVIQGDRMPSPVVCEYSEIELADQFYKAYGQYMTFEVRHREYIRVDNFDIVLSMRLDAMLGMEVHENKTTSRQFNPYFYERSLQWRIYLMAMQTPKVQYNVFPYKEPAPMKEGQTKRRKGARELREVSYFPVIFHHGGDTMIQEVEHWTRNLINFCQREELMSYITVKE